MPGLTPTCPAGRRRPGANRAARASGWGCAWVLWRKAMRGHRLVTRPARDRAFGVDLTPFDGYGPRRPGRQRPEPMVGWRREDRGSEAGRRSRIDRFLVKGERNAARRCLARAGSGPGMDQEAITVQIVTSSPPHDAPASRQANRANGTTRSSGTGKTKTPVAGGDGRLKWSGIRDSNSRPIPWQGIALPTELIPQNSGSPTWARTRDLRINSPALYRLSYRGICCRVGDATASVTNFWLPDLGSNQGPTD